MPPTLVQCTVPELQKCPAINHVQSCSYDCFCSEYDLNLKPSNCSGDQVFVEYKIQFIDRTLSCFGCVDCSCGMIGYKKSCGADEVVIDTAYYECPDCKTTKVCVLCGPSNLNPCRGSADPCCGNPSPDCCSGSTDPCCGNTGEECNPCLGSADPCCGSTDPCCGSSNPECNPCILNPDAEGCNPCFGSEDPCCGSTDPCCGSSDPCCGVDPSCQNGCADYCGCHPEDPDCQPQECDPPPACGPCQYQTSGCNCDSIHDPCCEDPESCA
jgi:hypothetical protein